jgi:hypothetical protein
MPLDPVFDGGPHQLLLFLCQSIWTHRAAVDIDQCSGVQTEIREVVLIAVYSANTITVTWKQI